MACARRSSVVTRESPSSAGARARVRMRRCAPARARLHRSTIGGLLTAQEVGPCRADHARARLELHALALQYGLLAKRARGLCSAHRAYPARPPVADRPAAGGTRAVLSAIDSGAAWWDVARQLLVGEARGGAEDNVRIGLPVARQRVRARELDRAHALRQRRKCCAKRHITRDRSALCGVNTTFERPPIKPEKRPNTSRENRKKRRTEAPRMDGPARRRSLCQSAASRPRRSSGLRRAGPPCAQAYCRAGQGRAGQAGL